MTLALTFRPLISFKLVCVGSRDPASLFCICVFSNPRIARRKDCYSPSSYLAVLVKVQLAIDARPPFWLVSLVFVFGVVLAVVTFETLSFPCK